MHIKAHEVTSLISSRICHDLVSPLGALGNGLELLELSGLPDTPEFALMRDSLGSALARVEFFRLAYGPAAPDEEIGTNTLHDILDRYYKDTRMSVQWTQDVVVPRNLAKLLFLIIQCVEQSLPFGGKLRVHNSHDRWYVSVETREVRVDLAMWNLPLTNAAAPDISSAQIQYELARLQAAHLEKTLDLTHSETALEVMIS